MNKITFDSTIGDEDNERPVTVTAYFTPPSKGARDGPGGPPIEPDDPGGIEIEVSDADGNEVMLSDADEDRLENEAIERFDGADEPDYDDRDDLGADYDCLNGRYDP